MALKKTIRFFLNGKEEECAPSPETTLLEYLRNTKELTGTKEGCGEGDCGACTVVVGEVIDGRVRYKAIVSCLVPVAQLTGLHVITIEGMTQPDGNPHPIQRAIVDAHATQCGFCTPGIALALLALYLENSAPTSEDVHRALSGNLCRCTGYVSIRRVPDFIHRLQISATHIRPAFLDEVEARQVAEAEVNASDDILLKSDTQTFFSPGSVASLKTFLRGREGQGVQYLSGGSDVFVVVKKRFVHPSCLVDLRRLKELQKISEDSEKLTFGGGVPLEKLGEATLKTMPVLDSVVRRMASKQVRTSATAAGNICNASPVGDMTALLMAMDAQLHLDGPEGPRTLPLEKFYLGYKKLALRPLEWIEAISVKKGIFSAVNFEKASKRKELDISTVNSAIALDVDESGIIRTARVCCGGVGPTTLFMPCVSAFLAGKKFEEATFVEAAEVISGEATPMSDVRGSADYRQAVMKNLMIKHFLSLRDANV